MDSLGVDHGHAGAVHKRRTREQYFFRVIAYDRAGNIEKYPADYVAFTTAGSDSSGLTDLFLPAVSGYLP